MFNKPSLAVLIDCWETPRIPPQWMYQNIVNFINKTSEIETVVLANYGDIPDSPKFLEINKKCVKLKEISELVPFLINIQNIYVMGANWTECVRVRPLGYLKLSLLPNVRILTLDDCVQENGEWVDFGSQSRWLKLKDNKFLYLGQKDFLKA